MSYRNGNYTAFYVKEPFNESNLGAYSTHDFVTYNQLKAWKAMDSTFPFCDSHDKTYNVRDNSNWETLKQRLHERLGKSKNIILILSSTTKNSNALYEELNYGINTLKLPVIVIYREFKEKSDIAYSSGIKQSIKNLWDLVPTLRNAINSKTIPTLHIPMNKDLIRDALFDGDFMLGSDKTDYYNYIP